MCGLAGFLFERHDGADAVGRLAERMCTTLTHRGPDHAGVWSDMDAGVVLGFRRLAIVDLSPAGHQPMISESGRFVLSYNGEIYNHQQLRDELATAGFSISWRGHSDTETLLGCVSAWGVEATLKKCVGMFAISLWDRQTRTLTLARDRLGEKPLYYGWQGSGSHRVFLFGSELKALREHPAFERTVNRGALSLYLRHGFVPAPYSIYQNIGKLAPGTMLTVSLDRPEPVATAYWSALDAARAGSDDPFRGSPDEAIDELEAVLGTAISGQMIADVPLGAFLSGGIDSSTVVALMQARSAKPVKTFSIGFEEAEFDESQHARAVAAHLGTDHTELLVTAAMARAVIPDLPRIYDEPFADSSQIPTHLVSRLAKQNVTVALSGDGGDELFGGYNRYAFAGKIWRGMSRVPRFARRLLASGVTALPASFWDGVAKPLLLALPREKRLVGVGDKLHKSALVLDSGSIEELYRAIVSHWSAPREAALGADELPTSLAGNTPDLSWLGDIERMMALDMLTYLPDGILHKVDRAAMAVSLETRVPFLDHRVVEFAWRLPIDMKMRDGQTKWPVRELLYRHVPRALVERPKAGFSVPVGRWLQGPLRDWAETLISEERLQREGYFDPAVVRQRWSEHLAGRRNWSAQLWDVLMFQSWLESQA